MKRRAEFARRVCPALIALVTGSGGFAAVTASGFSTDTVGSRAGALAAFVATADDASAIYHNPAGTARLQGWHVYGGVSNRLTKTDMDGVDPYPGRTARSRSRDRLLTGPHLFITRPIRSGIVAGVGVTQPVRLATDWFAADDFGGRFVATTVDLDVTTITPSLAIEALPRLSIGVGLIISTTKMEWTRRVPFLVPGSVNGVIDLAEEQLSLSESTGLGVSGGVLYDRDRWRLGASVRTGHEAGLDGDATYSFLGTGQEAFDDDLVDEVPGDHEVTAVVSLPLSATVGLARAFGDNLWLSVDATYEGWSSFEGFRVEHADPHRDLAIGSALQLDDTIEIAAGAAYRAGEKLRIRGGYAFVPSPMNESDAGPAWVDSDRHRASAGLGYTYEAWTFDFFHALSFHQPVESRNHDLGFDANYDQTTWSFALSLGYTRF